MSFKKFNTSDILINTIRAYPDVNFTIYNGNVYYNNTPDQDGVRNSKVRNTPAGYLSLYEYNIDRPEVNTGRTVGSSSIPDNARIYPWISKDSAGSSFKTVTDNAYSTEFQYGDILRSTYPLSASITREYITTPSSSTPAGAGAYNSKYVALRNRLNYYSARSPHYAVSNSYGNKDSLTLNMIHIPSIFYGTRIKPGSVSLQWYYTGSSIATLTDKNENGELIQISSSDASAYNDKVAGVVLYEEGIILLSGSWNLNAEPMAFSSAISDRPKWIHFGAGANDNAESGAAATFRSGSYRLLFKGVNDTQVMTMFAHAKRGEVNFSNNPSFIEHGQEMIFKTSSNVYHESDEVTVKNFVSSSYPDYSASFERQVFISKIGIYDKNKNLIGVATLAKPILKKQSDSYTFKLKLDI